MVVREQRHMNVEMQNNTKVISLTKLRRTCALLNVRADRYSGTVFGCDNEPMQLGAEPPCLCWAIFERIAIFSRWMIPSAVSLLDCLFQPNSLCYPILSKAQRRVSLLPV